MTPTLKAKLREELGSLISDAKLARVYRAVLEGIREPSLMMAQAGKHVALLNWPSNATAEGAAEAYRAMIDALLSQGEAVE